MRRLTFRGLNSNTKENMYGMVNYVEREVSSGIFKETREYPVIVNCNGTTCPVVKESVAQSVGLEDKDEVTVFEYDIIEFFKKEEEEIKTDNVMIVLWSARRFQYIVVNPVDGVITSLAKAVRNSHSFKVIGDCFTIKLSDLPEDSYLNENNINRDVIKKIKDGEF